MPVFLKIDPNGGTQVLGANIPDATTINDGVMTKLQAQQLATLVAGGGGSGGAGTWNVTDIQTTVYDASANDLVRCTSTAGDVSVVLPTAVGIKGKQVKVVDVDSLANDIVISTLDGQTICGKATINYSDICFDPNGAITFVSDGANWMIGDYFKGISTV